jgi:uncharacterized protein YodC (DUF2158 family)
MCRRKLELAPFKKARVLHLAWHQKCYTCFAGCWVGRLNPNGSKRQRGHLELKLGSALVARANAEVWPMSTDFKPGDVVRHKSGGQEIIILRLEGESVAGVTKKLAFCGRFEGQNFHQETIPLDMLEFVDRQFSS